MATSLADLSRHFDILLHDAQVSVQVSVLELQHLQASVHGLIQSFIIIRRRLTDALELLLLELPQVIGPAVGKLPQQSANERDHQRRT